VNARRPRALEAGLFLLVVALPLVFFPQSRGAFLDVKLLLLAAGTLLVWVSGLPVDRRIAYPALAWGSTVVVAALVGVDPVESLIGTVRGTGLVMLLCAAALAPLAPSIPRELLDRARGWLVWTGVVVAAIAVAYRVSPEIVEPLGRRLSFVGSTLGNPVRVSGFLAACVPAALAGRNRRWSAVLAIVMFGAGFAAAEERSAFVLPVVALAASAWFLRPAWRWVGLAAATIGAAVVLWALVPTSAVANAPSGRFSAVGQFQTLEGERQRVAVYAANARAVADRPLLGWGPANTWSGFLSSGTSEQIDEAGRNWADAHNLPLELAVVSGVIGLAAFGWLLVRIAPRALRPPPERAWLAAASITLAAYALVEPLDVVLTPLMLLFAGAAAGRAAAAPGALASPAERAGPRLERAGRAATTVVLFAATLLAGVNLGASALEEWGHTHFGADWALRAATHAAPWRLTASEALATSLAVSGRAGDGTAAAEARDVVTGVVQRHPMNPGVRLLAADVELLLGDFAATQDWIREQLKVFPHDTITVPTEEPGLTLPT
jgi:hypothetical protein